MSDVVFVILVSVLIASIAAATVTMARFCTAPACPGCGSKEVLEEEKIYRCALCDQTWHIQKEGREV